MREGEGKGRERKGGVGPSTSAITVASGAVGHAQAPPLPPSPRFVQQGARLQNARRTLPDRHTPPTNATHSPPHTRTGYLVSTDAYMNLQLASTEEYVDGKMTGALGEVLVRCNNVLYVRAAPPDDGE